MIKMFTVFLYLHHFLARKLELFLKIIIVLYN